MRNTTKNAVSKQKRRSPQAPVFDDMISNFSFVCSLYLAAQTMTYKDIIIPNVPQIEISLDNLISDWEDE